MKVYIIGDSISIQYGPYLEAALHGVMAYARKEGEEEAPNLDKDLIEVVFVVSADTVRMAEVKTGIQDDTYIQVTSGMEEGEQVVIAPYAAIARKLKQGDDVNVVEEEELYKKD